MSLNLITPASATVVTIDEAKRHLRVSSSTEDADIIRRVKAATRALEHRLRRSIMPQVWERVLDDFPAGAIELGRPPIRTIDSVKYLRDPDGTELNISADDYTLDKDTLPGWVLLKTDRSWPTDVSPVGNAVRVRFSTGYATVADVPTEIIDWILLATGDLYANRERSAANPVVPHDFAQDLIMHLRVPKIV